MEFYVANLLVYILNFFTVKKKNFFLTVLSFGTIFMISSFRDFDMDYRMYYSYYTSKSLNMIKTDIGFKEIISIFRYYNLKYQIFLIVINFYFVVGIGYIYKYKNKNLILSVAIYFSYLFFYMQLNQIRNLIAIVYFYIFYIKFMKTQKKIYLILSIGGYFIHSSLIILIPIGLIIQKINLTKLKLKKIFVAILIMGIFKFHILLLELFVKLNIPLVSEKIYSYMFRGKYVKSISLLNLNLLKAILISFIFIYFFEKFTQQEKKLISLYVIGVGIFCILSRSSAEMGARIGYLFIFIEPLLIGIFAGKFKQNYNKVIKILVFIYISLNYLITYKYYPKLIEISSYYC